MAYEAEGMQIADALKARYGKLLEARLESSTTPGGIVLKFERCPEWPVERQLIFRFGYPGSGPDCFHAFLYGSGWRIPKERVVSAREGEVLRATDFA
jgi:hypothetical protein